jgi:thioredoxin reductase
LAGAHIDALVVGGGDSAVEAALALSKAGHNRGESPEGFLRKIGVEIVEKALAAV